MSDASVSECQEGGSCACSCNPQPIDDNPFWQDFNALLIQLVCLVEKRKLNCTYTTSELRKAGKDVLCNGKQS